MAVKRITLNLDEMLVQQIDEYAEKLHINRTAAISVLVSQSLETKQGIDVLAAIIENQKLLEKSSAE